MPSLGDYDRSSSLASWPGEGAVVSGAGGLTRPSRREVGCLDARLDPRT